MDNETMQVHLEYIRDGVDEINQRLDALNGRTRKVESLCAVHSWALGVGGALCAALFIWLLSKV